MTNEQAKLLELLKSELSPDARMSDAQVAILRETFLLLGQEDSPERRAKLSRAEWKMRALEKAEHELEEARLIAAHRSLTEITPRAISRDFVELAGEMLEPLMFWRW